jgi:hypothetical protein
LTDGPTQPKVAGDPDIRRPFALAPQATEKAFGFGMIAVCPNERIFGFHRFLSHFGDSHG